MNVWYWNGIDIEVFGWCKLQNKTWTEVLCNTTSSLMAPAGIYAVIQFCTVMCSFGCRPRDPACSAKISMKK